MSETVEQTKTTLKQALAAASDKTLRGVCEVVATRNGANGLELKIVTKSSGKVWYSTLRSIQQRIERKEIELIDANTFRFVASTIEPW